MENKILIFTAIFLVGFFTLFIFFHSKEPQEVKNNCKETNYFVIGDKGHVNRIYDCEGNIPSSFAEIKTDTNNN